MFCSAAEDGDASRSFLADLTTEKETDTNIEALRSGISLSLRRQSDYFFVSRVTKHTLLPVIVQIQLLFITVQCVETRDVGLMLFHRLRRWTNNKPALGECLCLCLA